MQRVYFEIGRIFRMLADYEPVLLEDAPNPFANGKTQTKGQE